MKADLHIHTNYSFDAKSSPEEVVNSAIEKGIDCVCITDHREIQGAIRAMKFAFDKNLLVVPGQEIETNLGDVLAINIKKLIPNRINFQKALQEIKKQKGLAIIAHPFHFPFLAFKGKEKDYFLADGIEAFNASLFNFSNRKALEFLLKHDFCFTAGSDAHNAKMVGKGYLKFLKKINSEEELLEEIKNKSAEINGDNFSVWEMFKDSFAKKMFYGAYYLLFRKPKLLYVKKRIFDENLRTSPPENPGLSKKEK